jgi:hypothetical protein
MDWSLGLIIGRIGFPPSVSSVGGKVVLRQLLAGLDMEVNLPTFQISQLFR